MPAVVAALSSEPDVDIRPVPAAAGTVATTPAAAPAGLRRLAVLASAMVILGGAAVASGSTERTAAGRLTGRAGVVAAGLLVALAGWWSAQRLRHDPGRGLPSGSGRPATEPDGGHRAGVSLVTGLVTVLVGWWLAVTVATFWYPAPRPYVGVVGGRLPSIGSVLRGWSLLAPWWPGEAPGRLPQAATVAAVVIGLLGCVVLARRRTDPGDRRDLVVRLAPVGLLASWLVFIVVLAIAPASGSWAVVARAGPLVGLSFFVVGLLTGMQPGHRWLDTGNRAHLPLGIALLAAATVVPGGEVDAAGLAGSRLAVAASVVLAGLGSLLLVLALFRSGRRHVAVHGPDRRGGRVLAVSLAALVWYPIVLQLWVMRTGGVAGVQRYGTAAAVALIGSAALGAVTAGVWALTLGPRRKVRWTAFSVGLAVVSGLSLAWRLITLVSLNRRNPDGGDPFFYHQQANMLADGLGYGEPFTWARQHVLVASAIHPPAFSTWLSIASLGGARTFLAHKAMAAILGTGLVVVAGLIGRRIGGNRVGILAAALVAAYPHLWVIDGVLWPEAGYTFVVGAAILATYRWRERPTLPRIAALGALVGVAALMRGEALLLGPLLILPAVLGARKLQWKVRARHLVLGLAMAGAVLVPWTVRNYVAFHQPVALSTNSDEVLYYANCPDVYYGRFLGYWSFNCQERARARGEEPPGNQAEKARVWRQRGIDYALDHTGRWPVVAAARLGREFDLFRPGQGITFLQIEGRPRGVSIAGLWSWAFVAPVGLIGLIVLRRRRLAFVWPLAVQLALVTFTALYAYGAIRFRTPAELALLVGTAVALDALVRRIRHEPVPAVRGPGPGSSGIGLAAGPDTAATTTTPSTDEPGRPAPSTGSLWARAVAVARRRSTLLAALVPLAVLALPLRTLFRYQGPPMEEGFMLTFPQRLLHGALPNQDFLHLYGPGSIDALAGWFAAFGTTLQSERSFGLVQHAGIVLGAFLLTLPWGRWVAAGVGVLAALFVVTPIGLTALAWNGAVALALLALAAAFASRRARSARRDRRATRLIATAGLLAGLSLTFRPDLIAGLGLATVAVAWAAPDLRARWRLALTGFVAGLVPLIVHVALVGPATAFDGMIADPVFRLRAGRSLPVPPSWDHIDGTLQAVAQLRVKPWPLPGLSTSQQMVAWFFLLPVAALLTAITGLVVTRRHRDRPTGPVLLAIGALQLGLLPQAFQRPDSTHLAWVSCVVLSFLPAVVAEWLAVRRAGDDLAEPAPARRGWRTAAAVAAPIVVIVALVPFYTARVYVDLVDQTRTGDYVGYPVVNGDRRFYLGNAEFARDAQQLVDALRTKAEPGDKLIVGSSTLRRTQYSDAFLYFLLPDLPPGTRYIEMDPGVANAADSGLADEVRRSQWVVKSHLWDGWNEPNTSMDLGAREPEQVLHRDYCRVGEYGRSGTGPAFELWANRTSTDACPPSGATGRPG